MVNWLEKLNIEKADGYMCLSNIKDGGVICESVEKAFNDYLSRKIPLFDLCDEKQFYIGTFKRLPKEKQIGGNQYELIKTVEVKANITISILKG